MTPENIIALRVGFSLISLLMFQDIKDCKTTLRFKFGCFIAFNIFWQSAITFCK
jgi:hypothetical protein